MSTKRKILRGYSRVHLDDQDVDTSLTMEEKEYKEPDTWTIITALNRVLDLSEDCGLSDEFWESCKNPLKFLNKELGLSNIQLVVLAIMIEEGAAMTWKKIGNHLGCSRLSIMCYSEEIEELVAKRWLIRKAVNDYGGCYEGFALVSGVVTALRHNKPFIPEKIDGLTEQEFIDRIERHTKISQHDRNVQFKDEEEWLLMMATANPHLPLCREVLRFKDIHVQSLLLMTVIDYAKYAETENEGLTDGIVEDLYNNEFTCNQIRDDLISGRHVLIRRGYIEHKCSDDGIANTECYVLTRKAKTKLLSKYKPRVTNRNNRENISRHLKKYSSIKEKTLFFNPSVQEQIQSITNLLSIENLPSVQQRLEEQGMRKGFACLFYGSPGTGKTETVYQIARQTGRDLVQIDIAGLRDKYVGESEKNIKEVFSHYREICKESEAMPILFFNEADAIINKRTENVERSVDKMDNAMQNIILQEIEDLEGILIATTNLTANLDKAFERRFLFKVEFCKPDTEVKTKIWSSMLNDISIDDARQLASHFDFSGGQIENIARKCTIDYILSGKLASLEEIEKYCKTELLVNRNERRHIAGFNVIN